MLFEVYKARRDIIEGANVHGGEEGGVPMQATATATATAAPVAMATATAVPMATATPTDTTSSTAVPTGWMVERVATTIVKPSPDSKLGIVLETTTGSGKIEIVSVVAGSPTEAAGLRTGDVVVEIAGRPAPPTAKECTALLKEAVGECAVIVERMPSATVVATATA